MDVLGECLAAYTTRNVLNLMKTAEKNISYESTVKQLMSPAEFSLRPQDKLTDAVKLMSDSRLSCVMVCENHRPVGIITERDIIRVYAEQLDHSISALVDLAEAMTPSPICLDENTSVQEALILARSWRVRHLPIIDGDGLLIGLITQNDMMESFLRYLESSKKLQDDYETMRMLSLEDPLLGTGNRRALELDLAHTEAMTRRYGKPYSVAMFDVDHFKSYNDFYGHQSGDIALQMLVTLIRENMRESDRIYRYGGEEFLLLMPDTDLEQSFNVVERIRGKISDADIPHHTSPAKKLTISVGVACALGESVDVVKFADEALYYAKQNGRNRAIKHDALRS